MTISVQGLSKRFGSNATAALDELRRCARGRVLLISDQTIQQESRFVPIALHGALRYLAHLSNVAERESAKEFQIDAFGQTRIDFRERVERFVEVLDLDVRFDTTGQLGGERGNFEGAPTLLRITIA